MVVHTILRSGILDRTRRRYVLSFDGGYILRCPDPTPRFSRRNKPSHPIEYINNHQYCVTSRPHINKFECQLQTTYRMPAGVCDSHFLQLTHVLLAIKLSAYHARERSIGLHKLVLRDDPPLLQYNPRFERYFHGPTIYHWTIRTLYRGLTTTADHLAESTYHPQRKFTTFILPFCYIVF